MNSGKSLKLIQEEYIYRNANKKTFVLKPSTDNRHNTIKTRLANITLYCYNFDENENLYNLIKNNKPEVIFIDEAHFLTKKQVFELREVVDTLRIDVFVYGLRTDFTGNLFEGSKFLFSICDDFEELYSLCHCGAKATMNARVKDGTILKEGPVVELGSSDKYISLCYKCFNNNII